MKHQMILFEDGAYIGVEFEDLPGVFSQGNNLKEARIQGEKALNCYYGNGDGTHQKLCNDETQKVIVLPMNVEELGEKLAEKIKKAAGI